MLSREESLTTNHCSIQLHDRPRRTSPRPTCWIPTNRAMVSPTSISTQERSCLWRRGRRGSFAYEFAKNDQPNLRPDELRALRRLADEMLALDRSALDAMLANGTVDKVE